MQIILTHDWPELHHFKVWLEGQGHSVTVGDEHRIDGTGITPPDDIPGVRCDCAACSAARHAEKVSWILWDEYIDATPHRN